MKRGIFIALLLLQFLVFSYADTEKLEMPIIKETYKLQGLIEYDDNPVDTIYLDENIDKPQVNIPKRSLTLPVGVLNITSNTNTNRSALARASVNRNALKDILPLSGSVTENLGYGFSYGQIWEQELSNYSQIENTTAFFLKYDTPRWFSITSSMRQATYQDIGTQYNIISLTKLKSALNMLIFTAFLLKNVKNAKIPLKILDKSYFDFVILKSKVYETRL